MKFNLGIAAAAVSALLAVSAHAQSPSPATEPAQTQTPAPAPTLQIAPAPQAQTPPAATPASPAQAPPAAPAPTAAAAPPAAPAISTTKIEGTDNVYLFRYGGHQSIFIVTPQGVIATDPISYRRPAKPYIDAIKAVTDKPIKYLIYSHHHYDHAAGGQAFKDAGATIIAHRRAKERLMELKKQNALLDGVLIPDETVDSKKTIKLGGTTLELNYLGRNHSDNSLVMRLPKEKLVFTVDFAPIEAVSFRNIPDNASPLEFIDSLKKLVALDWDRMVTGHPYAGGRMGTKKDVQDHIAYLEELSAEVKKAAADGKCWDVAMREIKLPKYEKWSGYANGLAANVERFCYWWSRGY